MKKNTKKIAITTSSFGKYDSSLLDICEVKGLEVTMNPYGRKVKSNEFFELAQGAIGIIAGTEPITRDVLAQLPHLKVISRCGTGLDNVDMCAAEEFGIKVFNTPDAPTIAVAELTIGLILSLLRKTNQMDRGIREGKWEKLMGNLLYDKRVGIIGFGRIGSKVADMLVPFGCKIAYYDINDAQDTKYKKINFGDLLKKSNILSIHVSSREKIIGKQEINLIPRGVWLVNVSRGGVVDEDALYFALKEKHLSGAALDVFEQEPYTGKLKELNNIILTPHIGSYAVEARVKMEMEAVENLLKGLRNWGIPQSLNP